MFTKLPEQIITICNNAKRERRRVEARYSIVGKNDSDSDSAGKQVNNLVFIHSSLSN